MNENFDKCRVIALHTLWHTQCDLNFGFYIYTEILDLRKVCQHLILLFHRKLPFLMLILFRLKFTWNSRWSLRPCTLVCRLFGVEASSQITNGYYKQHLFVRYLIIRTLELHWHSSHSNLEFGHNQSCSTVPRA